MDVVRFVAFSLRQVVIPKSFLLPRFLQATQVGYSPESLALMEKIAVRSGIEKRHTCLNKSTFGSTLKEERAVLWERFAPALAERAGRAALAKWRHGSASDITHVIVHSCTGFSAPGLDFHLITSLGLRSGTRKIGVNFMGCFGGFTTMFVAKQVCGQAAARARCVPLPHILALNRRSSDR